MSCPKAECHGAALFIFKRALSLFSTRHQLAFTFSSVTGAILNSPGQPVERGGDNVKRSSLLIGIAVGSVAILAVLFLTKLIGFSHHDMAAHQQAWGHGFGRREPRVPIRTERGEGSLAIVWIIARIAVLALGAAMFFKAKGLYKWTGAVAAALALTSLLTPWATVAIIVFVIWLTRRMNKNDNDAAPVFTAITPAAQSRGQFLDEWERSQKEEDN